jgi:arylsulfatase A-like enzyme
VRFGATHPSGEVVTKRYIPGEIMDFPPWRALTGGFLLAAALVACSSRGASLGPDPACQTLRMSTPATSANLVLIVNDTMRRDRVGIYGGPARTPTFDAFAKQNFYFDRAFTNADVDEAAVATMLTSLYPSQHGLVTHPDVRDDGVYDGTEALTQTDVLSDGYTTLAEALRAAGFRTAAFVSNPWMAKPFGFGQGFEIYDDSFAHWNAPGDLVSRKGARVAPDAPARERFFLYLHYIDSHRPYGALSDEDIATNLNALANDTRPQVEESQMLFGWLLSQPQQRLSATIRERLAEVGPRIAFVEMAYDRGIEAFDRALDPLLSGLAKHPSFDHTAVVITADHGEALFERGYGNHGTGLFDNEAAIPMAARLPGMAVPVNGSIARSRSSISCRHSAPIWSPVPVPDLRKALHLCRPEHDRFGIHRDGRGGRETEASLAAQRNLQAVLGARRLAGTGPG